MKLVKNMTVSTDLSGTFVEIPKVLSVDLPEVNPDVEERTYVSSTDAWPTKVVKKISYGDIRLRVDYDPVAHAALDRAAEDGLSAAKKIKIVSSEFGEAPNNYRAYEFAAIKAGNVPCKYGEPMEREYTFSINKPVTIGS